MNRKSINQNRCSSLLLALITGFLPWQPALAESKQFSTTWWLWLYELPDWVLSLIFAIVFAGLFFLALDIYRRTQRNEQRNRLATIYTILSGMALGIILAVISIDAWKNYAYQVISKQPPTSAGIPQVKAGLPMNLLEEADPKGAALKPNFPKKVLPSRARHARVNFNALHEDKLVLNLFDDIDVIAILDRIVTNMQGGQVWIGHIEDEPDSEVTLAAKGPALMGMVEWNNRAFEIVYINDTTHAVRELDPNKVPENFEPEAMSTGHGVTNTEGDTTLSPSTNTISAGDTTSTGETIDVLAVYTPQAKANAGGTAGIETKIMNAIARANQSYLNSQINMQLNLVHMAETNYTETGNMTDALPRLRGTTDGYMDDVHGLRDQYAADQVILVDADANYCGYGYIMTSVSTSFASNAFVVVHDDSVYNCIGSYDSLAHELGHNQGNVHNPENTSAAGAYPYSYGYRVCGSYRSIMSYNCSGEPRIPYFANPNVLYNGMPTGVANFNDTARSMNETAATVASFRSSATTASVPTSPANLVASANSTSSINLAWTDNASDETGYYVQRSMDGVTWALIATLQSNSTSFSDSGLSANTSYSYRVDAYNSVGNSNFSNVATATTQAEAVTVAPPAVDSTAPTVTISNPQNNDVLSGSVQKIDVDATDDSGIANLSLYVDGKLVASGNTSPLSYALKTRKMANGSHKIEARASDASNNTSSTVITVQK